MARKCKKDVKLEGAISISPLESTKAPKKQTQTNSKQTGKTRCIYPKKSKQSERMTQKGQV
jgi:hypothetical protein